MNGLDSAVVPDIRLILDASVLIAHLTGTESTSAAATILIDDYLGSGRNEGVISSLTLGEALVGPVRVGRGREVGLGMLDMPGLQLRSVDFLVAAEAARIRAESGLRMPDAVVIATGVLTSAGCLVTNDRRLAAAVPQVVPEMAVCLLADHV